MHCSAPALWIITRVAPGAAYSLLQPRARTPEGTSMHCALRIEHRALHAAYCAIRIAGCTLCKMHYNLEHYLTFFQRTGGFNTANIHSTVGVYFFLNPWKLG